MQDRPTAAELLRDIADLLEGDVLAALSGPLQHQVRVAGNLARIVQRELELAPSTNDADLVALGHLAASIRDGDPAFRRSVYPDVLASVRAKLAVNKPGHDDYDFAAEQVGR